MADLETYREKENIENGCILLISLIVGIGLTRENPRLHLLKFSFSAFCCLFSKKETLTNNLKHKIPIKYSKLFHLYLTS
jgi:hypothetical protein